MNIRANSREANGMRAAAVVSTEADTLAAGVEVASAIRAAFPSAPIDLACLFITPQHARRLEEVVAAIHRDVAPRHLIGCTAESVVAGEREFEQCAAISLWAASFPPGAVVETAHVRAEETPDGLAFVGLPSLDPPDRSALLLFGEPFSFRIDEWLRRFGEDHAGVPVFGGMASGSRRPGENRLFLGGRVAVHGAVVAKLGGTVSVRGVVSQGCRPFGEKFVVTRADGSLVFEIGGVPALERLKEQASRLSPTELDRLSGGVHLGIAIDPRKSRPTRGDFLVRNIVGWDDERGLIAVADAVRPGATVQFHLRDAEAASEDLADLLDVASTGGDPVGGLLFSCNGRGSRLFDAPDHDAGHVSRRFDALPLGGFFAAGELGPIAGRNFLHGFTASAALFEPLVAPTSSPKPPGTSNE